MLVFKLQSDFRDESEITDLSNPIQKNWRPKDHTLEAFIQQPAVIDAFVKLVLDHYDWE